MNPNNPSQPPEPPKGLLYMLQPEYCDEYEFMQRLIDAEEKGKLYAPPQPRLH